MSRFNVGDIAYIIESKIFVKEVVIVKVTQAFITIKYTNSNGGFRIRESRLYKTKAEAEKNVRRK